MRFRCLRAQRRRAAATPLATPLALVLALAQLTLAHAGIFAGALALGFLLHGPGHGVSLQADAGHVDVVLHHPDEAPAPGAGEPASRLLLHEGDHVVHLAAAEALRDGSRVRLAAAAASALPSAAPLPAAAPTPHVRTTPPLAPPARALLRTIVLRI